MNKKIYEIDKETTCKMKAKMLEMLLYFKNFCEQHHLMFYLIGGGAIGAVREHGFLAWDDDLDCLMPRYDYEKFKELWDVYGDKNKYVYCRTDKNINYHHSCTSLRDPNTTFICEYNKNQELCHGLALEIGPVDACPLGKFERKKQLFWMFIFALFNTQRLPNNKGIFYRKLAWLIYKIVPSKELRYKIWKYAECQMSKYDWDTCKYVTETVGCIRSMLTDYPKEEFTSQQWFDFEGYKVPLMAGYDHYLTVVFGDYMTPPPIKERVARHILEFVDMDKSYVEYRGIKYFPGKSGNEGGAM